MSWENIKSSQIYANLKNRSGIAVDSPTWLRFLHNHEKVFKSLLRLLRLRFSPLILQRIRNADFSLEERAKLFAWALQFCTSGKTYKITGFKRTRLVDDAIINMAHQYPQGKLMEVGCSDGSSCIELINALPRYKFLLTDNTPHYYYHRYPPFVIFADSALRILSIKFLVVYLFLDLKTKLPGQSKSIDTLNPKVPQVYSGTIRRFDIFSDVLVEPVNIIKCANILNISYFSAEECLQAIQNLSRSLADDGTLFISHNLDTYANNEAYVALRKKGSQLKVVEEKNNYILLDNIRQRFS
jgi:hypothetical protein